MRAIVPQLFIFSALVIILKAQQLFMKFCILEYRPWRCLAEVCSPSSSLLPSIPANETLHSDNSLALIKILHFHPPSPPKKTPKKYQHRFYNIFQPIMPISGVRLWLYQECLRPLTTVVLVVSNWRILFNVKGWIGCLLALWWGQQFPAGCWVSAVWIGHMKEDEMFPVIRKFIHWQNFFFLKISHVKDDEELELNETLTR